MSMSNYPQHGLTQTLLYRPYVEWLSVILSQPRLPLAISTSYGDDEQTGTYPSGLSVNTVSNLTTVPQTYAVRVCNDFAQLGAVALNPYFE
jgi:tripeptidyl-peptidase-1